MRKSKTLGIICADLCGRFVYLIMVDAKTVFCLISARDTLTLHCTYIAFIVIMLINNMNKNITNIFINFMIASDLVNVH